jgi:hypothetical protein
MTKLVLLGIPLGPTLSAEWVMWHHQWLQAQRTFEMVMCWGFSNTKSLAYSAIIDSAKTVHADRLFILETNHTCELSAQQLYERCELFDCSFSPQRYRYKNGSIKVHADPVWWKEGDAFPPVDAAFKCRGGGSGLVNLSKKVIEALKPRYYWPIDDVDHPIYAYDGDLSFENIREDLPFSLFANVRSLGFDVFADPLVKTVNWRREGLESYR